MIKIAIFASGSGTNAAKIIDTLGPTGKYTFKVYCNKPNAGVLTRATQRQVESQVFSKKEFLSEDGVLRDLLNDHTHFIVLAGFLWLMPSHIIKKFPQRIVNIHPALLPSYGGKGMYGAHVHEAVIAASEKKSGITIHWVNENYDEGATIFQDEVHIEKSDTAESLAEKIHVLEHLHFPRIIDEICSQLIL